MISERELWACALQVMEQHGGSAPLFVAERIGMLALQGDEAGIATWKAIASKIDQLSAQENGTPQAQ